ncbi:MAG: T9SS C-terminal target domain-containing protein, partial [Calditrichaeota bacterium]
ADVSYGEDSGVHTVVSDVSTVFADPDPGDILSYSVASSNPNIIVSLVGSALQLSAATNFYGSGSVMLTATDSSGLSASDTFLVTITPVNDPPVVSGLPDTVRFKADTTLLIWNYVSDPETPDSLLSYQFSSANDSLLLSFDSLNGRLTLSATLNFRGFSRVTVTVTDDSGATAMGSLMAEVLSGVRSFSRILQENWNLVSLPLQVSDPAYLTLFPNAIPGTLYGWDGSYLPGDTLFPGNGYWLRFPAPDTVQITGMALDSLRLHLRKGWNLIGGISRDVPLSEVVDNNNILIPGTLYGFDGTYYPADTIRQGEGFWVNTYDSGTVSLTPNPNSHPGQTASQLKEEFIELSLTDRVGHEKVLLFADESLLETHNPEWLLSYSLPPIPPPPGFDVRFKNHSRLSLKTPEEILLQANQYPLTLTLGDIPVEASFSLTVEELLDTVVINTHHLSRQTPSVSLVDERVEKLKIHLQKTDIPLTFTLEQNYPNPFNPTTTIPFEIPVQGWVKLTIYDVLGRKIQTLVNENLNPGRYFVKWDGLTSNGEGVTSGVYIYRLTVKGNTNSALYSGVKKMLLLR